MKRVVLLSAALALVACKRAEAPASATAPSSSPAVPTTGAAESASAPAAPAANPSEKAWKVKPTPLSVIKADPPSYLGTPTLVFVTVKPTSYFNYGYSNARNSHFAFELRSAEEGGHLGAAKLYGYAARSWARPFFEEVNKQLDASKKESAPATLVVAYSKKRYDGRSADHIEILAAVVGERLEMDPAVAAQGTGATVAPKGRSGDCKVWREIQQLLKKDGNAVAWQAPRHCADFPAGSARKLMDLVHRSGFSQLMQFCMAWQTQEMEPGPDAPGIADRAEAKWQMCAERTRQAGWPVRVDE